MYVAVVVSPAASLLTSTLGTLFVISFPFISVINFLKAKSNGFGTTIDTVSENFCGVSFTITTGCSVAGAFSTDQYSAVLDVYDESIVILIPAISELVGIII